MTQEVLKLALEALEEAWYHVGTFQPTEKAIDLYDEARAAIKEALAQPEQEPVAWLHTKIEGVAVPHRPADLDRHPDRWTALYKDPKPCPTCEALARTVMLDQTSHDTAPPAGDIRALKYRIHELEAELFGYKKIVEKLDTMLERQTARIVDLQTHIENFDGEDR